MSSKRLPLLALVAGLALASGVRAGGPAKDLKSRDVKVRLAAVERLEKEGGKNAEKILLDALGDRDWEVVERAIRALGKQGGEDSIKHLLKLAVVGPTRRIRIAATESVGRLDPERASRELPRSLVGEYAESTAEALAHLGTEFPKARTDEFLEGIARALAMKEVPVRRAAARAIAAYDSSKRRKFIEQILDMPEASVRAALLDAIRAAPDTDDISYLVGLLGRDELPDVLSRRTIAALIAIVASCPEGEERERAGRAALSAAGMANTEAAAARFVRLAGLLAEKPEPPPHVTTRDEPKDPPPPPPPLLSPEQVDGVIESGLANESPEVRAAAARALQRIATKRALDRALTMGATDASGRVRLHALRAVARTRGPEDPAVRELLESRLGKDEDERVREYAAVALGRRGLSEAVPALVAALKDEKWEVAVCAAVSLGKTGDPAAVEPLRELLGNRDWKLAGAGVVGLAKVRRKEAVPDVIGALASRDTSVKRSAWEALRRWAMQEREPTVKAWTEWWEGVKEHFEFVDLEKLAREQKKYGYADNYRGVYENLDVIVLQSRGDTIEKLLDHLTIKHRMTRSAQVEDCGVHPWAVFVVNCTGEIVAKDVERLQWFVRVGGYLFGSCWALSKTIEQVYPGVVRKLPVPGEVLANVIAEECPTKSPFLTGVFPDESVRPIYVLYGSHLIDVLDPERAEVLIDSPETADTWPEGNLACWFDAGHGVILDSANHFDLQGLARVDGLRTAEDRMAYAMDHLGIGYEEARALSDRGIWRSQSKATAEARDLSAFRFITNFVRYKRRLDH